MKTANTPSRAAVAALAGFTMAAAVAAPVAAGAADAPAHEPGNADVPQGQEATTSLAASGLVKAAAVGTFSYDQTTVSSTADILKLQGASDVLCGAKDARCAADAGCVVVRGDVAQEFVADLGELVAEEPQSRLMTCSCGGNPAGGRAIVTADVKGVPVEYLLTQAGASASANTLTFVSADGSQVSVPLGYAVGRHAVIGCELNGEDLYGALGGSNQLWMAKTPANYFLKDVVEIVVSTEENVPEVPGAHAERPNSPNAGILTGSQA